MGLAVHTPQRGDPAWCGIWENKWISFAASENKAVIYSSKSYFEIFEKKEKNPIKLHYCTGENGIEKELMAEN